MSNIKLLLVSVVFSSQAIASNSQIKVIYGSDNRKDVYQASSTQKKLASSTAGMVFINKFTKSSRANHFDIAAASTLEEAANICPAEKFSQQLTAPFCSGFLVGPDLLVTAGHCYLARGTAESNCKNAVWVFDYNMKSAKHDPSKDIPITNIYTCKEIVAAQWNAGQDYAIIRLNRKVTNRSPLKIRTSGNVSSGAEVMVIGHPTGLPTKIADKGRVTLNSQANTFSTTLDTFHGNSGSAVFDAKSGEVEGILIQGKTDYQLSNMNNPKSCKVVNVCDDRAMNCSAGAETGSIAHGEVVFRIGKISALIQSALK